MKKAYIVSFSSFYKAAYGRDKLLEQGIKAVIKRLPPELVKTCGYGIYVRTDSIEKVRSVFKENSIQIKGIYRIDENNYIKIK